MRTTVCESLPDHIGVGFQDHRQVGPVGFGVELPQKSRIDAVETLNDQAGRDVAVGDNNRAIFQLRAYFGVDVVIPVRRI